MTHDLKNHLKANPQLTNVYVNDKNEWQFFERAGYDKVLTRDEVLAMEIPEETEIEETAKAKPGRPKKDVNDQNQ
jgi:hypothetical protein